MDIEKKLSEHLKRFNTAPFLFIGSGLSRRYIGLEKWDELLEKFSKKINNPYKKYTSAIPGDDNEPEIASLLAKDFYDIWWNNDDYKEKTNKFDKELINPDSPLKIEIAEYIKEKELSIEEDYLLEEIEELKQVTIDGVITTNWDNLLEDKIFKDFEIFIGQDELLFSNLKEIAEIYKIHGCCKLPNSLVLTKEDYETFNERNPYLAAKLLTIFIEHPIVFLGHSLRDSNILNILKSISSCLTKDKIEKLRNNLIFVEWNKEIDEYTMKNSSLETKEFSLPITIIEAKYFTPIFRALKGFKRKVHPKVIRKLKDQVYNMVKTTKPTNNVRVVGIDNDTDFDKVDIICGVGLEVSKKGYESFSSIELFEDIIFDKFDEEIYDMKDIVNKTLPQILKTDHYIPIYKYLRKGNFLEGDKLNTESLPEKVINKFNQQSSYDTFLTKRLKNQVEDIKSEYNSVKDMMENNDLETCIELVPALGADFIEVNELKELIIKFYEEYPSLLEESGKVLRSRFRKIIRIFDWLKYRKEY